MALLSARLLPVLLSLLLSSVTGGEDQDCPQQCLCAFRHVTCYNFSDIIFEHLPVNTSIINLRRGRVKSFPPRFLQHHPTVQLLDIKSCEVEVILSGTFSGVTALEHLAISDCNIGSIQEDAFSDLNALSVLYLSGSEIGTIDSGAFSRLSRVEDFSMWSNKIGTIAPAAFRNLSDFQEFSFFINNVTVIAPDAFDQIEGFSKVKIYLNRIHNIAMGSAYPLQRAAKELNIYSNTLPCDCGIMEMSGDEAWARYVPQNLCMRNETGGDAEIVRLQDLPEHPTCKDRVNITTPTGSDVPTSGSPPSDTAAGVGDSDRQSGRNPGHSNASRGTVLAVSLTIVPVVVGVGLTVVCVRSRIKQRANQRLDSDGGE